MLVRAIEAGEQLFDGLRLVAFRLEARSEAEARRHGPRSFAAQTLLRKSQKGSRMLKTSGFQVRRALPGRHAEGERAFGREGTEAQKFAIAGARARPGPRPATGPRAHGRAPPYGRVSGSGPDGNAHG